MQRRDIEFAARWWQWAMAIPADRNPVSDETGEFAGEEQPADVWFLAGTFGGKVSRKCAVPFGRPIFFPAFNILQKSSLFARRVPVIPTASGHAELNGVSLPLREVANRSPFLVDAVPDAPFGPAGRYRANAWGLWCRLDDLRRGDYILTLGGEYEPGGFWVEVTYDLEIV
ncbi:hypothetical protein [Nocardia suismassiliense]|uniref:hypothetical protein n=1 Tax=Nocardia suismassiliense TaxID=2077092 RepID=UPI00131F0E62|nr:hypothetical protein [Nocardia suismassiliense]